MIRMVTSWLLGGKATEKGFQKAKAQNEQRSCGHSAHFIVGPNCGTDLVGRKELATLLQTTAQDDCLLQFPNGIYILWDTPFTVYTIGPIINMYKEISKSYFIIKLLFYFNMKKYVFLVSKYSYRFFLSQLGIVIVYYIFYM